MSEPISRPLQTSIDGGAVAAYSVPVEVSVIVPVYNEEGAIQTTLDLILETLPADEGFELIVVEDGSTDRTGEVLEAYATAHPGEVRVVTHDRNRGYGAALKSGIRAAGGPLIVITDADGTYPIRRIPDLVLSLRSGHAAMVIGARTGDNVQYSRIRRIPKVFLKAYVEWVARTEVPDFNSGLRVFRKDLAEKFFGILPNGFSFTTTITLAFLTNQWHVEFVPISYATRVGKSKIQPIRDTIRFTMLILRTGMYFAPLRVLGPFVLVLLFFAMISLGVDLVYRDLTDSTVLLFLFAFNTGVFALLADMIDKRVPR